MREVRVLICTVILIGPSKMPNAVIKVEKITASDCQCKLCNSLGFDPSIRAANEVPVLNKVHKKIRYT
jgi:hypothetical protein